MIFVMKDALRQSVEAASGGLCTVMYTRKGQPVFLRAIPKFRVETLHPALGSGVHPAFIVGGREISEFWVGMYPGYISQGELLSVPGRPPSTANYGDAISLARANGPGFHHMTAAEWAAVALYTIHALGNDTDPVDGPDPYGMGMLNPKTFGVRVDGKAPGDTSSISYTLGGSGPLTWRHDGSPFGISDLVRGIWPGTHVMGLILRNGEINIIPNNDAALATVDLTPTSNAWRAILPNGTLVSPGTSGTLKYDVPTDYSDNGVADYLGPPVLGTTRRTPPWPEDAGDQDYAAAVNPQNLTKNPTDLSLPALVFQLLLFPHVPISRGRVAVRPYGVRATQRGYNGLLGLTAELATSAPVLTRIAYIPV